MRRASPTLLWRSDQPAGTGRLPGVGPDHRLDERHGVIRLVRGSAVRSVGHRHTGARRSLLGRFPRLRLRHMGLGRGKAVKCYRTVDDGTKMAQLDAACVVRDACGIRSRVRLRRRRASNRRPDRPGTHLHGGGAGSPVAGAGAGPGRTGALGRLDPGRTRMGAFPPPGTT